jgi:Flp pilus assembly protein TadG
LGTLVAFLPINLAFAQDLVGAANAFSRAQKAELSGDHAAAAELFELADSLVPSPEALRSALRSRQAAGQLSTAALHAETLLARYPDDERSKDLVDATLEKASEKLMRYQIDCQDSACAVLVDGAAATVDARTHHVLYLEPGTHLVIAAFGDTRSEPQVATGNPGTRASLSFSDSPAAAATTAEVDSSRSVQVGENGADANPMAADQTGLPRWVFMAGVAVTIGVGVAAVWSGMDVLRLHEKYQKNRTAEGYQYGQKIEQRTNILIGATAAAAVGTGVLAIFTQWNTATSGSVNNHVEAAVGIGPEGGLLSLRGTF